ncbi:hypothetical protein EBT31_17025 [bacterium]|nr:hypothetical protein [bacterium]
MSILQTQTTSFKVELYQAIHNLTTDTLKMALYTGNADLNESTTAYTSSNEVTGTGYVAGGVTMTGVTINSSGFTAYVDFSDTVFNAAVTARCALIYNSSKANRSIAVLDFGSDKTSANFTVVMPANTADAALIRSSN